jgi:mono/diheme cytochrome c family protein
VLAFADDSPVYAPKVAQWLGRFDEEHAQKHPLEEAKVKAQEKAREKAAAFQEEVKKAEKLAGRAAQLAMDGVPEAGSRQLLRHDPLTKGHELFKTRCAACHSFTTRSGEKGDKFEGFVKGDFKASDLGDYASEPWIRGLLEDPSGAKYFGRTELKGMKKWKASVLKARKKMSKDDIAKEEADLSQIARWLAEQAHPADKRDKKLEELARPLFDDHCASCHKVGKDGGEEAPDLTNYGSQAWLRGMILAPGHKSRHGDKNAMPAFRPLDGPGTEIALQEFLDSNPGFPKDKILELSDMDRELIVRFVTRDFRVVFGGDTISGVQRSDR